VSTPEVASQKEFLLSVPGPIEVTDEVCMEDFELFCELTPYLGVVRQCTPIHVARVPRVRTCVWGLYTDDKACLLMSTYAVEFIVAAEKCCLQRTASRSSSQDQALLDGTRWVNRLGI